MDKILICKIIIPLFLLCSCGNSEKAAEELSNEELVFETPPPLDSEFEKIVKTVTATVVKEPFVNQGGHEIEGVFDFFLNFENQNWFVKFSAGKVLRTDLENIVGQTAKFSLAILDGLWDTDDPMMQSRIGKYVAIYEILE